MGNTGGKDKNTAFDKAIKTRLVEKKAKYDREVKLLLLGTGDSGKTTIAKQFRLLYGAGSRAEVDEDTLYDARTPCLSNIIEGAKFMVRAPKDNPSLPQLSSELDKQVKIIEGACEDPPQFTKDVADAIAVLWEDESFQELWNRRSEIQVLDCWGYFAEKCKYYPEWGGKKSWHPNVDEFLFTRVRTSGIVQENFLIDGVNFLLVDVGGQKNERKKWSQAFDGVTAVLFVAATSEYDQALFEDLKSNRLKESLEVFGGIANGKDFQRSTIILFLNKADIFQEKLCERKIPLNASGLFPEAPDTFDFNEGMNWIRAEFLSRAKDFQKAIVPHVTCAVDQSKASVVLEACKNHVLEEVMMKMRILG